MAAPLRLFVAAPLTAGSRVEATPGQAHHLGIVMRRTLGDPLLLFNGIDGEWRGEITHLRRDRASFAVIEPTRAQATGPDLWLLFAPLKRDATDLVAQKATELGVAALCPVVTERTVAARVNAERMSLITIEAAEQCERLTVPRVESVRSLPEVLATWDSSRLLHVAAERLPAPRLGPRAGPVALLIGPEGGFTGAELDALRARPFVRPASLGPRILRAETAAIVGLALLQAQDDS